MYDVGATITVWNFNPPWGTLAGLLCVSTQFQCWVLGGSGVEVSTPPASNAQTPAGGQRIQLNSNTTPIISAFTGWGLHSTTPTPSYQMLILRPHLYFWPMGYTLEVPTIPSSSGCQPQLQVYCLFSWWTAIYSRFPRSSTWVQLIYYLKSASQNQRNMLLGHWFFAWLFFFFNLCLFD